MHLKEQIHLNKNKRCNQQLNKKNISIYTQPIYDLSTRVGLAAFFLLITHLASTRYFTGGIATSPAGPAEGAPIKDTGKDCITSSGTSYSRILEKKTRNASS